MKLYKLVWLYVFVYSCIHIFQNAKSTIHIVKNFFKNDKLAQLTNTENQLIRNQNSYLVLIGMDTGKYSFFYQPDSVMLSFGGHRKDIFEQSLLSLNIQRIYTLVSSEAMMGKLKKTIQDRNQQNRWQVLLANRSKKYGTYRSDVRKTRNQIYSFNSTIPLPSTILFDLGDFSWDYLKATMQIFSDSCVQYVIYNRKRPLSNLKTIKQMMERSNFRQVKNVKSQYIATFVSLSSPLWNK